MTTPAQPQPAADENSLIAERRGKLAALRGQGSCPSTGTSAARTTGVIDAILGDFRNAASAAAPRACDGLG